MKAEETHTYSHTEMAGSPTAASQQTMHGHFSGLADLINVPLASARQTWHCLLSCAFSHSAVNTKAGHCIHAGHHGRLGFSLSNGVSWQKLIHGAETISLALLKLCNQDPAWRLSQPTSQPTNLPTKWSLISSQYLLHRFKPTNV